MNARMIMHPEDAKAIQTLKKLRGLDTVAKSVMEWGYERLFKGENLGELVKVTEGNYPVLYRQFVEVVEVVGIHEPELYLYNSPVMNAYTYGDTDPFVAVSSSMVERMEPDELKCILAHECGHILCRHTLYQTVLEVLEDAGSLAGIITEGVTLPLVMALRYWSRRSELSADRCAAAVMGERTFQSAMLKLASGLPGEVVDPYQLVRQAEKYEALRTGSLFDRLQQGWRVAFNTHPQMCHRAREIDRWKHSWQYKQLRAQCPS